MGWEMEQAANVTMYVSVELLNDDFRAKNFDFYLQTLLVPLKVQHLGENFHLACY